MKITYDSDRRIILMEREEGFYEEVEYKEDGRTIVRTHYPDGQEEIERFGSIKQKI